MIELWGNPRAQCRHRHRKMGNHVMTYDPLSSEKSSDRILIIRQMSEKKLRKCGLGPVYLDIVFGIAYPKSTAKKRRDYRVCGKKPDIDNYLKYIFDVMSGVLYEDDGIIASVTSTKIYTRHPFTLISWIDDKGEALQDHVLSLKRALELQDVEYIARKASLMGLSGKQVISLEKTSLEDGDHYYFEWRKTPKEQVNYEH